MISNALCEPSTPFQRTPLWLSGTTLVIWLFTYSQITPSSQAGTCQISSEPEKKRCALSPLEACILLQHFLFPELSMTWVALSESDTPQVTNETIRSSPLPLPTLLTTVPPNLCTHVIAFPQRKNQCSQGTEKMQIS